MSNLEKNMIQYGIAIQLHTELGYPLWTAYIMKNIFEEDGSECFGQGATPTEAVQKCADAYVKWIDTGVLPAPVE